MKFSTGRWASRDGVTLYAPAEVSDVRTSARGITIFAPVKKIASRDDTLNTPQITIELDAPLPDVVRVCLYHHRGDVDHGPRFAIAARKDHVPSVIDTRDEAGLVSGGLRASVQKKGEWRLEFAFDGRRLTGSGKNDAGYLTDGDGLGYMRERLSLDVGECLYGLGERFTAFVKNGQVVDIWNEDGGTASELAYKNIPFYLSSSGYGVLVAHPGKVSFEVGSEVVSRVQFSRPGGEARILRHRRRHPERRFSSATRELTGRPGAAAGVVVRSVAHHVFHDELRREDGARLRRGHALAGHPPARVPFRLLLDEGVPVVRPRVGSSIVSPTRRASSPA